MLGLTGETPLALLGLYSGTSPLKLKVLPQFLARLFVNSRIKVLHLGVPLHLMVLLYRICRYMSIGRMHKNLKIYLFTIDRKRALPLGSALIRHA